MGVLGTAVKPSVAAAIAPSLALTLPKTPISCNALFSAAAFMNNAGSLNAAGVPEDVQACSREECS